MVENLSAVQETWVQSLGWEDPLENEIATHPRDGGAWWAAIYGGHTESDTTEAT